MSHHSLASKRIHTKTSPSRNSAKSIAASKLAARVHALSALATRKTNAEVIAANDSTKDIAGESRFAPLNSDEDVHFVEDDWKRESDGCVDVHTPPLNPITPFPHPLRSLTPNSMAIDPIAEKLDQEVHSLTARPVSPIPGSAPLFIEKLIAATEVLESISQPPITSVEQKIPPNSETGSEANPDPKPTTRITIIRRKQAQPPPNPRHPKSAKPGLSKSKITEPLASGIIPKPNPPRQGSIPQRIFSEIAARTNEGKTPPFHDPETEKAVEMRQITEKEEIVEQKKVSEPMSLITPLNDECTVEDSMYPFKLVLSPLEERPLEKVEIWISTCPPSSIASVFKSSPPIPRVSPSLETKLQFIHTYLIPLDIAADVDLKHLRRLRKVREYPTGPLVLEVILCGGESISRQELAALMWSHSEEIPQLRPRLHLASKWAAYTLQQYETFSKLWPVTMRTEAKRRLAQVPSETSEMQRFMAEVIRLSQRVFLLKSKPPYDLPIATLIVDPSTSRVLASTYDTRVSTRHPLNHSVVTAINLLAMSPHQRNSRDTYYASGYDFYTTHEPCVMCCMAMVHSRARRCVFWKEMRYTGGKGLGWKKELNHKYMCFQWIGDEIVGRNLVEDVSWDICA